MEKIINVNDPYWVYILGFAWADGHVRYVEGKSRGYHLHIGIGEKDGLELKPIFEKASSNWKFYKVKRQKETWQNQLQIMYLSKAMAKELVDLGFKNKEQSHEIVLTHIPKNLHYLFWRGLVDGDGHLKCRAHGGKTIIQIASCYDQDWSAMLNLYKSLDIEGARLERRIDKRGNKGSKLSIESTEKCLKLVKYLYQDYKNIGLSRKRHQAEGMKIDALNLLRGRLLKGYVYCHKYMMNVKVNGKTYQLRDKIYSKVVRKKIDFLMKRDAQFKYLMSQMGVDKIIDFKELDKIYPPLPPHVDRLGRIYL